MAFKPMEAREFIKLLKIVGWSLKKSGFDYSMLNEKGKFLCTIKITHEKILKVMKFQLFIYERWKKFLKKRG